MTDETQQLVQARRILRSGVGRAMREQAGLSLAEFGASLEPPVPGSTIWRWEKGAARPRRGGASAYLEALKRIQHSPGVLDTIGA